MGPFDLIFPKYCLECRSPGSYLCSGCLAKMRPAVERCPYCNFPSFKGKTHQGCLKALVLDGAFSVWRYQGVIRKGILGFKYKFASEIAQELGEILVLELRKRNFWLKNFVLAPVPLHWQRLNWRGFNQSQVLGQIIAQKMNWGFQPNLIIRKKKTKPQVELSGEERKENVKDVFELNPEYQTKLENYVIFDDVWTTGSTIKEIAKVLKENQAGKIWGLTMAR